MGGGALYNGSLLLAGSKFNCLVGGGGLLDGGKGLGLLVVVETGLSSYLPSLTSNLCPCHSYPFKISIYYIKLHVLFLLCSSYIPIALRANLASSKITVPWPLGLRELGSVWISVCNTRPAFLNKSFISCQLAFNGN